MFRGTSYFLLSEKYALFYQDFISMIGKILRRAEEKLVFFRGDSPRPGDNSR